MPKELVIVVIILAIIIVIFLIYLLFGNFVARANFGAKFLKNTNKSHLAMEDNPYRKIMNLHFDEENKHENIKIKSYDNLSLSGFLYVNKIKSHNYIIGVHGWGSSHLEQTILLKHLMDKYNLNLLLIDQRAQGTSEGTYCSMGDRESKDVYSWITYLKSIDQDAHIVLYGNSLGASTILLTASRYNNDSSIKGVIADAPYVSAYVQIKKTVHEVIKAPSLFTVYPLYLALLIFHHIDLKKAAVQKEAIDIKAPTLIINTNEDKFIPPDNTKKVYDSLSNDIKKETKTFPTGGHCLASLYHREEYFALVEKWIEIDFDLNK